MTFVLILLVLALVLLVARRKLAPILRAIPNGNKDFSFKFHTEERLVGTDIAFYFDFSSPYGYFAASCIDDLAARYGRSVRWFPILMPAIFKVTGSVPLPLVPIKGPYILRDFERTARLHGIAYCQPKNFPMVSLAPARAMLWVGATHGEAAAVAFAKRCYCAYFSDGIDICDPNALAEIGAAQGISSAALVAGSRSNAIKQQFMHANEVAIGLGVFGSPFVIADGEPFWGFDHFYQLEAYLRGKASPRFVPTKTHQSKAPRWNICIIPIISLMQYSFTIYYQKYIYFL